MRPQIKRAKLPPGCWWIVHLECRHLTVILDEAVPRDSAAEEHLTCAALRMWREEHRRDVGGFPASTVATGAALLLVVAAATIAYVLTGAGVVSGPQDGWAEAPQSSPGASTPHRPQPTDPARSPAARPAASLPAPSPPIVAQPSEPAAAASPSLTSTPLVDGTATPVVRHPVRKLRSTVRARPRLPLPVKVRPRVRPCELLGLPVGHCR